MPEFMYLVGSEDVRSAAHEMARAAETMRSAAAEFGDHVRRLEQILSDDRDARAAAKGEGEP